MTAVDRLSYFRQPLGSTQALHDAMADRCVLTPGNSAEQRRQHGSNTFSTTPIAQAGHGSPTQGGSARSHSCAIASLRAMITAAREAKRGAPYSLVTTRPHARTNASTMRS